MPRALEPVPGSWFKVFLAYLMVFFNKYVNEIVSFLGLKKNVRTDDAWYDCRHVENIIGETDQAAGSKYNDSFYFWGSQKDGKFCVSARLGFQAPPEVTPWLSFLMNGKSWCMPRSIIENSLADANQNEIRSVSKDGDALHFKCEEPMKRWNLKYDGMLVCGDKAMKGKMDITLDLAKGVYFYEKDWDLLTTAKAISAQPWDRAFFKNLRSEHQCHYEQGGVMTGYVSVGKEQHILQNCPAFRDHSFGKRDWTFMKRYFWLGTLSLYEPLVIEGKEYKHMTGTLVEYGNTFKHLIAGGLIGDKGKLSWTLASHMEDLANDWFNAKCGSNKPIGHLAPRNFSYKVQVKGGHMLEVECSCNGWDHSFVMQNNTFEVYEMQAEYTITYKNQKVHGNGIAEFGGNLVA